MREPRSAPLLSTAALAVLALLAAPGMLIAQGMPLGPEFRVNTYTTSGQRGASVASDSADVFVVAWSSDTQDGSSSGIFAQRYASQGTPLGAEFRLNTYTTGLQQRPFVASDSTGNFVVAWESNGQDGSSYGVFAQRYGSTGTPMGGEFRVNTYTTGLQQRPSVASDSTGEFVVAWESNGQDGSSFGVFAQRYASTGTPMGGEFRVNTYTTSVQSSASVASDSAGNFVVAWNGGQCCSDVFAQRYASTGIPLGGEFRVNTYIAGYQFDPSVASDSAGNFVIAWSSDPQDGSAYGVFAQRYANTGTPLGGEFRVNTYTTSRQASASVASDSAGNFVIAWDSEVQDDGLGVFAQRYASMGAPLGGEFRVNTYTTSGQGGASVASDSAGNFVVAWSSDTQDGSSSGIFAQRYSMIVPVELQTFTIE